MINRKHLKTFALLTATALALSAAACNKTNTGSDTSSESTIVSDSDEKVTQTSSGASSSKTNSLSENDIKTNEEISNSNDSEHAIEVNGETSEYSGIMVTKTGNSDSGDEADFYGDNSAIFATNGATLTLTDIVVDTDGKHANAVFSYGDGTTVNISNAVITTSGNCSGGLMTTGGGTMNASNLTIHTTGNSSAAIRSDRGGGTVTVDGGSYTTNGTGSPVIYSTADITVSNAYMESTASQGVVVEGKNSVTLNNVQLVADNNTKNSDKSDYYQAVMIYQSMSGDAAEGLATFTMTGGSLTNANGDIFFVNNTVTTITLENVEIVNQDSNGVFLRAAAAGWGSSGPNGGKVNLYLNDQTLDGDIVVDSVSALNMYLASGTTYTGAVNTANEGEVYVQIESGSKWILTADSYITALTCDADGIDLNGHTLYVNGVAYTAGTSSTGTSIEMKSESTGNGGAPDGKPGDPPSGSPDGKPGDPPSGDPPSGGPGGDGNEPPAKPKNN